MAAFMVAMLFAVRLELYKVRIGANRSFAVTVSLNKPTSEIFHVWATPNRTHSGLPQFPARVNQNGAENQGWKRRSSAENISGEILHEH